MPNYTCPPWSQGASCLLGMSACVFLTPIFLQITRLAVRETFLEGSAGPKGQGGTGLRRKEGALALPFSVLPSPEMQSLPHRASATIHCWAHTGFDPLCSEAKSCF